MIVESKMLSHRSFLNKLSSAFLTSKWSGIHLFQLESAALIIEKENIDLN